MSEANFFIAAGKSLTVVRTFRERWEKGQKATVEVQKEWVNPDKGILCLWADNDSAVHGLGVTDDAEIPEGFRIDKKVGRVTFKKGTRVRVIVPDLRRKVGKALEKRFAETRKQGSTDLARALGLTSLFSGEGGSGGFRMPWIGLEQLGSDWVLQVDVEYKFEPPGAVPLKRSDYWSRKEAKEARARGLA